jgi:hypothetical protein
MEVTFHWEEVQLIAKLGGWEPHKDRTPGKITFMRGLRRLIDMLATQAVLSRYASEHQGLPPISRLSCKGGALLMSYEWMSGEQHLDNAVDIDYTDRDCFTT